MRVFIGIKILGELKISILKWQEANKNLPVRFIQPENLHITVVPPWHEKNVKKLASNFKKLDSQIKPFSIYFEKITLGPPNRPRLIWLEGQTPIELPKLKGELSKYFKRPRENRPFKTHITIARFKNPFPQINDYVEWKMEVSEIVLFESILSQAGAQYRVIETLKI